MRLRRRLATWLLNFGCRHAEGTVCEHRYYTYDHWYRGYLKGFTAGESHERRDWETASPELIDSWRKDVPA